MRKKHTQVPPPPEGRARTPRDSTPESRARSVGRMTTAEVHDPEQHPVDQAWRGWQFEDWLSRPAGKCELSKLRGGRLTEEVAVHVGRILAEGLYQYHAEALLGLSERAIANWCYVGARHALKRKDWCKRARRFQTRAGAVESLGPKPERTLHMQFLKIVRKAEAIGETTLYGALIMYALNGDAKTAMWILERKYPERYGRLAMRTDIELDEHGKPKINPVTELAAALEAVAEKIDS